MSIHNNKIDSKIKSVSQKKSTDLSRKVLENISRKINKKEINELAWTSNFNKRASSKITGFQFIQTMLLASVDPEHASLEKISDLFRSQHKIRIRSQSLMERINTQESVCFLKSVFENLLENQFDKLAKDISPDLLSSFSRVLIQDSSSCDLNQKLTSFYRGSGGRASKSSLKLDVVYDFKAKKFKHINLHEGCVADQALANGILQHITEGSLVIRDLGFLQIDCLIKIVQLGAFFLSRMKNNTSIFLNKNDKEQVDFAQYLHENFRKTNIVDINVFITGYKIPVRLIAYKVPQEIAAKRRRLAHAKAKKEGRTLSQKSLTLLDFSIFITNISTSIWPAKVVGTVYRIRWQIELIFKNWKGKLKVDCLLGINNFRIESLIYLRLIYVVLINEIYRLLDDIGVNIGVQVSMNKVYNWLKCTSRLLRVLSGRLSWWEERYLGDIIIVSMSQQKRKRKTTLQMICENDFYYIEAC